MAGQEVSAFYYLNNHVLDQPPAYQIEITPSIDSEALSTTGNFWQTFMSDWIDHLNDYGFVRHKLRGRVLYKLEIISLEPHCLIELLPFNAQGFYWIK